MSLTHISKRILEVPALERDFHEGALFDARNEKIVLGYSLWNANDLSKIKARRNDGTPFFTMNASDTLSGKLSGLECNASVQLSILSGLIEMKGSLKYLKENKNNRRQSSVQVRCLYKTAIKEMGMDQLTNIRYPEVARTGHNDTATHFVMKIQYGAGAIFNFTCEFQSEEEKKRAKAEIEIFGKNILGILNGNVRGNADVYNRSFTWNRQIRCEFHSFGLSLTEACPTTYEDAIKFAGNLSRMASHSMAKDRNGEALGVPCIVWLHPLVTLPGCANAPKLHYEFDLDDVARWTELFKDIDEAITFLVEIITCLVERITFLDNMVDRTSRFGRLSGFFKLMRETIANKQIIYRKKIEEMTKLRSDSLIKLRELIVDVRSGRESSKNLTLHKLVVREKKLSEEIKAVDPWLHSMVGALSLSRVNHTTHTYFD